MIELPEIIFADGVATIESPSPELLRQLLNVLETELVRAGVNVSEELAPGIPSDQAKHLLESAGFGAPEEALVWYGWHNGSAQGRQAVPNILLVRLDEAIDANRTIVATEVDAGEDPEAYWAHAGPGWLRLGGDNYDPAIYCGPDATGPLHLRQPNFEDDDGSGKWHARSLCTWVIWRIIGIRNGAYGRYSEATREWGHHPELLDPSQLRADIR
jgi:hypothetical protein